MPQDIALSRCQRQLLTGKQAQTAAEIVAWFGAIQAQDYGAALWAIGQRSDTLTAADVERAISERQIVRTWPLRGTIHFVPATDLRWMLALTGARQNQRSWSVLRSAGIDQEILDRARAVLEASLRDGPLTRPEIYAALGHAGIHAASGAGLHILGYWAQAGLICFGPHRGKQPTFVLLDDWLGPPGTNPFDEQAALHDLAIRYFQSRGPASDRDFSWWSGLSLTTARKAIGLAGDQLESTAPSLWTLAAPPPQRPEATALRLLPPFDELLVAYKDRSAYDRRPGHPDPKLTFFGPTILYKGRLVGSWRKSAGKDAQVQLTLAEGVVKLPARLIEGELSRLSRFWARPFRLA